MKIEDRYLGDGVYASYDGYYIWLDLRAQDSTTRIALEPEVLRELGRYAGDVAKEVRAFNKEQEDAPKTL